MKRSKAEREAEAFRAEARRMFGHTSRVSEPAAPGVGPMGPALDEARRLATVHDPSKPSGCRICGRTVEPSEGDWVDISGWKTCGPCAQLVPGGLGAVLSELLGEGRMSTAEAIAVLERVPHPSPAYFYGRWATDAGQPRPWLHVDPTLAERGPLVLAEVRAERSDQPRVNTYRSGCCWCGVRRSRSWTATRWHKGGRSGPRVAACADCAPWIARSGGHDDTWRANLLAAATGMRRGRMGLTYDLRAWWEVPGDPEGTEEPWEYLGETRSKLRGMIIRQYPMAITITAKEQRVLDLERTMALAEHPPERPSLANVD